MQLPLPVYRFAAFLITVAQSLNLI